MLMSRLSRRVRQPLPPPATSCQGIGNPTAPSAAVFAQLSPFDGHLRASLQCDGFAQPAIIHVGPLPHQVSTTQSVRGRLGEHLSCCPCSKVPDSLAATLFRGLLTTWMQPTVECRS